MAATIASKLAGTQLADYTSAQLSDVQPCTPLTPAAHTATSILGTSCRYPKGCTSSTSFWETILSAKNLPSETALERWDLQALYEPDRAAGKVYARFGAFLDKPGDFDCTLFGLPYAEAVAMDPQSRILLEEAHEALSAAHALTPGTLGGGSTGTYVGCMYQEYADVIAQGGGQVTAAAATGNSLSFMVGRCATCCKGHCVSHYYNSSLLVPYVWHKMPVAWQ